MFISVDHGEVGSCGRSVAAPPAPRANYASLSRQEVPQLDETTENSSAVLVNIIQVFQRLSLFRVAVLWRISCAQTLGGQGSS